MRRSYLITIIILGIAAVAIVAAGFMRSHVMDTAVQKVTHKLLHLGLEIDAYSAPITSPLCYQNIMISGKEQEKLQIQNLCLEKGILSLVSNQPNLSISCGQISGNLEWNTFKQLKNFQKNDEKSDNDEKGNIRLDNVQIELDIDKIDIKLGKLGQQISWLAQDSKAKLSNHVATFQSSAPLKIDVQKAPFAFSNMPVLTLQASADLTQKKAEIKVQADPPMTLDTVQNDQLMKIQIAEISAQISQTNLLLEAAQTYLQIPNMSAVTQTGVQKIQAIIPLENAEKLQIQNINIIEPKLTLDIPKLLEDPKVKANPVVNAMIEFWQQEAGAILGKAPNDSVRREDVKKPKPPIRKNPIPPQTLENFRQSFARMQAKLKNLPTIDIQKGSINILNHEAHFDIQEIALNTENLFKTNKSKDNTREEDKENTNNKGLNESLNVSNQNLKAELNINKNDNAELNADDGQNKRIKNGFLSGDSDNQEHDPLQFQLGFNVRNAEADFSLNFDGDSPFPTVALDVENLNAADFLRLINMPVPEKNDGTISFHLNATMSTEQFGVQGNMILKEFAFFHEKISPNLIQNINASASLNAVYHFENDHLKLEELTLTSGPVTASGFVHINNVRSNPVITFELGAKDIPCRDLPKAIPTGFLPTITDLQMTGTTMSPKLSGKIPWKSPLTSSLKESGFENRCMVTSVLPHLPELLNNSDYTFTTNYTYFTDTITVGPGTDTYVPLSKIPPYVKAAMYLTEDKRFFDHGPLRISFIERALRLNLNQRKYVYGGSTISQQLTKNLFLTRSKNLARKLEEAFIAWRMETVVTKSRIFELYLNVIEFGPDIYGIKQAAHFYFDKSPELLTPLEGAFLASLKVSPSKGARFYKSGFPKDGRWWNKRLKYILKVLAENGYIAPADVIVAYHWIPEFFKPTDPSDDRKIWLDHYTEYLRDKAREKKQAENKDQDEND